MTIGALSRLGSMVLAVSGLSQILGCSANPLANAQQAVSVVPVKVDGVPSCPAGVAAVTVVGTPFGNGVLDGSPVRDIPLGGGASATLTAEGFDLGTPNPLIADFSSTVPVAAVILSAVEFNDVVVSNVYTYAPDSVTADTGLTAPESIFVDNTLLDPYQVTLCFAEVVCIPTTCAAQEAECGSLSDGCGGTLDCGTCSAGTCGGGGVPHQCGGGCTAFADDFTGTSLGPGWTIARGAFAVSDGAAQGTAPSSYAVWIGTPAADASVGITLGESASATYAGVIARADSTFPDRDHYAAFVGPDGTVALARRNDYDYSYLGAGPQVGPGAHALQLTVAGAGPVTLAVTLDGAPVITATDSSAQALVAAGGAGLFDFNGASRPLEHFVVGQASCGCTPTTCAAQGAECGSLSDGCGGTLDCGTCSAGTCGGGGVANRCGGPGCTG